MSKRTDIPVDVVITTKNNWILLNRLLESLKAQTYKNYTCCVIDNCSSDKTSELIVQKFPWVNFITTFRCQGPSINRNIAIEKGNSPLIVTLDDDVVLTPSWLEEMIKFIERYPRAGAIASQLRFLDRPEIINSAGGFLSKEGFGGDLFFNMEVKKINSVISKHRRVIFSCSAAMLIRREVFEKVGRFDPLYFYLCEDYDLSLRIQKIGYLILYNPGALAYHGFHSTVRKSGENFIEYLLFRNTLRTLFKNFTYKTFTKMLIRLVRKYLWKIKKAKVYEKLNYLHIILKAVGWNVIHIPSAII
ncbi:MAG: glycosyltransferase family 2 protein, partial [Candidatus Aminicenantes bacterium]|nr:glycosyltransferase family 2 protein [Candidatus Aminicenantes bacterium]